MERNILLELEYLGTEYFGFQIQEKRSKNEMTIQGALEQALKKLFKEKIRVAASGRTDRGVHARAQVVNFKTNSRIPLTNIKIALNSFLPSDIRVIRAKKVPLDFHARFSAKHKRYRYIIRNAKEFSVFWNNFAWQIAEPLNLVKIEKITKKLIGKRDFGLFAKEAKKYRDCLRIVNSITIKKRGSLIYIDIEANGFLRNMVRNIVSFLVKVARDKISLKQASLILEQKAPYMNKPAPATGLYLYKVSY
ncbi:MAG: tRNA pseudouridine(38-40) synthase TruA [Candidatus Omnitrophica bacterium]|nr:tRNA pseudouridine(38-40) synthase TruA [Candidatus Omnitrophota bacterium]